MVGRDLRTGSSHAKPRDPSAASSAVFSQHQCQSNQSRSCSLGSQQSAAMGQKKLNSPIMEWQEGAGGLLLLAAANATALLSQLEDVLPMKQPSSAVSHPSPQRLCHPHRRPLLTLLFLPAVGIHRFCAVSYYTALRLPSSSARARPYLYSRS